MSDYKPATYYVDYNPVSFHPGLPFRVMRVCPASGAATGIGRYATQRAAKAMATKRTNQEQHFNM